MVAVGINKSAEQYLILDEDTREELASGKYHDQRRGSFGPPAPRSPARTPARPAGAAPPAPRPSPPAPPPAPTPPPAPANKSPEEPPLPYHHQRPRPDQTSQQHGAG